MDPNAALAHVTKVVYGKKTVCYHLAAHLEMLFVNEKPLYMYP